MLGPESFLVHPEFDISVTRTVDQIHGFVPANNLDGYAPISTGSFVFSFSNIGFVQAKDVGFTLHLLKDFIKMVLTVQN